MEKNEGTALWKKVNSFVKEKGLIVEEDRVLFGLSGGADSVCLARFLLNMRSRLGTALLAVHVNHGIRGREADRDEAFTVRFCRVWDIPLEVVSCDVPRLAALKGMSLEEAGREARYEIFDSLAREHGYNRIAVAHHGNDLAETMLFRMARGTGPSGLAAMAAKTGMLIRPLLCLGRKEIEDILLVLGQEFVEDSSNSCIVYSRNFIRQQIIPGLEKMNPRFIDHMRTLSFLQEEQKGYLEEILDRRLRDILHFEKGKAWICREEYRKLLPYERGEALRRLLFYACGGRRDIRAVHVDILVRLMEQAKGNCNDLPGGVTAENTGCALLLSAEKPEAGAPGGNPDQKSWFRDISISTLELEGELTVPLPDGGTALYFRLEKWTEQDIPKSHCIKYFDYDKIKSALRLRTCLPGDYFVMDTAGRQKKLRRYCIDEKIPPEERGKMTVLAEGSHVMWIPGRRSSEGYRIDAGTVKLLKVEVLERQTERSDTDKGYL